MIYVISICILWLLFDQLTIVNVRASNLFQSKTFQNTPTLSNKIESDSHILEKVLIGQRGTVYYEPQKKYYVLKTPEGIAKVDAKGETVFKLLASDSIQIQQEIEGEHIILTSAGIINLHDDIPQVSPYHEVRHLSDSIHAQEWRNLFYENYQKAAYVCIDPYYASRHDYPTQEATHFYINNHWVSLINNKHVGAVYISGLSKVSYFMHGETDNISQKSNPLYILKDVKRQTYSNINRETDSELTQFYEEDFPHKAYHYNTLVKLKVKNFKKITKHNFPETIWLLQPLSLLPQEYEGEAITSLKIKNKEMVFKTKGFRAGLGLGTVNNNLYLFDIPSKFSYEDSPIFIFNNEGSNLDNWRNNGFYVVKMKR